MSEALHRKIEAHLFESARVKRALIGVPPPGGEPFAVTAAAPVRDAAGTSVAAIAGAAKLIADSFRRGGKLLLCGNGGSAADCQHMAAEFVSKLRKTDSPRRALPALALTTDTSFLTAYANDVGVEDIFSRQIEAHGRPGDVLIAISTSGSSPNVLRGVEAARSAGMKTVALTGSGGPLGDTTDIAIRVPSGNVAHIQEAHLAVEHVICELVEDLMFGSRETMEGAV